MCMNREFTKDQLREMDVMKEYAIMILKGITLADIALDEGVTEEYVREMIEKIKDINPYLYNQVQEKLAS